MNALPTSHESNVAPERRHVVILFTDLSESTRLSGAMEAETYANMLDDVRSAFRAAVQARGGVVNQFQGDGLQALFGHVEPNEDDGRRAAEAALEVHERVRALRGRYAADGARALSVHSGIHAGQALARQGDDIAGRIELFGPAPGIAKHLSDIAEADEILASDETLGPASHMFTCEAARHVQLKGRGEPLFVRRIVARSALRTRFEAHTQRGLVAFVGRAAELARLQAQFEQALAGRAGLAVVRAPAGLGKTRLVEEFLRSAAARGCAVMRGDCDAELSAQPLQPFLQMLRARLGVAPDATAAAVAQAVQAQWVARSPELAGCEADLVRALSPQASDSTAAPHPGALRAVIESQVRRGPLALFIDDWQWADRATRELLRQLRELDGPLLLLLTTRPGGVQGTERPAHPGSAGDSAPPDEFDMGGAEVAAQVIELAPLADDEATATIAELLPGSDPFIGAQIIRRAGGNPLFLEELCHFVASAGAPAMLLPPQGGPAWLERLIAARVARLPAGPRRVVDAAAVIGGLVPAWLLEQLTGCPAGHPDVTALAGQDLLFPAPEPGWLRFKHGITRDVVYGGIGLQARQAAHRRAAMLLATDAGAEAAACEALAYHHHGAGNHEPAARYSVMAGDKAMAASSIDRARTQYRAALDLMDRLPPSAASYQAWRSVVRRLGMASVFDPARADLPVFERAVALAQAHADTAGLAFANYWRTYVHYALGDIGLAVTHAAAALAAAQAAGEARLVSQVQALQGQALAAAGQAGRALAVLDGALESIGMRQRAEGRPTPALAYMVACRASVLGDRGQFEASLAEFARALALLPGPGHEVEGSVLCLRGNVLLWQGRWDEAAADAATATRVAEKVQSLYLLAMGRALGAWADWKRSGQVHALHALAEATAWLIGRDKRLFVSLNHGRLAEALASVGQWPQARVHAAAALRRHRHRDPFGAPAALRAMARAAAAEGRRGVALRRLALAERLSEPRDSAHERAANVRCRAELGLELEQAAPR